MARESPENHPNLWKWRLEWLAQTGIEKLAGILPGPLVFRIGEVLGGIAWHFMKERRQVVLRNLRIALHGEYDLEALRIMARKSFRRTGANLFSALHTAGLTAERIGSVVTVENPELVEEAVRRSPGVVLLPCHMGNWEILTRIHRTFPPGHANGALYRPLNNPLLDARVLAQREMEGTRLFSKRDSFHVITGFLREGGILGILADQRVGPQGELVRFFGRLTRASPLPSLVARRSKSQVLGMSLITESPGKWRIRYHELNGPATTANCMDAIERSMKASPLDVFWLQERWKMYLRPTRSVKEWLGPDLPGSGKPHRALLWLPGTHANWQLPDEWTHPDVIYEVVPTLGGPLLPRSFEKLYLHAGPDRDDRDSLMKYLETIDASAALPIDFILTCGASKALAKAARRLSIPLVSLPATA
ncbi:MAG: hypothetical protein ABIS50_25800 [Luteolibacter sp.]|uniref:lysophospholipid acyltransferase family protein n=1 Tax=Luteolibacter sp. TaxID=1962973 RepID=UPI00326628C2